MSYFLEWENKYIVRILHSAAEGGYSFSCYLSEKMNIYWETSSILEAALQMLDYEIKKYYCQFLMTKNSKIFIYWGVYTPHFRGRWLYFVLFCCYYHRRGTFPFSWFFVVCTQKLLEHNKPDLFYVSRISCFV
jgi:hypothetical protein